MVTPPLLVDVHTHMYPPSYMSLLRSRTTVPYVAAGAPSTSSSSEPAPRLIILPTDDDASLAVSKRGRPVSSDYWSVARKQAFMRRHGIRASVISLANPWLDWVSPAEAAGTARAINDELEALCAESHKPSDTAEPPALLYHFATLPLSASTPELVESVAYVAALPHCRGVVLGTSGLGSGLDDQALDSLWEALERHGLMVFIHPHYGLGGGSKDTPGESVFGPRAGESGHVLPLALGFPMETTIAFARMYLAAVFERFPGLKVLLAHAGGTLPFLAGRLESCVLHERAPAVRSRAPIWTILRNNVWLDGVVYGEVGLRAAVDAVGKDKVLWGTDHPFFPPLDLENEGGEGDSLAGGPWLSVTMNVEAAAKAFGEDEEGAAGVLGRNAVRALGLEI